MKKTILLLLFLFGGQSFLWSNPIDDTPIITFSELVFDNNNNWTMEIGLPFGYSKNIDSVIFAISNQTAKLMHSYPPEYRQIALITSDSLTAPLFINRQGDKIVIYTYSKFRFDSTITIVRIDSIIYGNHAGATVGQPVSGYSIMRNSWDFSYNNITIDCLTKNPSLGIVNTTQGLGGTLRGHIYDADSNLVTKLKPVPWDTCYFILETPIKINSDGSYTTEIYRTVYKPGYLIVRLIEFMGPIDTEYIEPFVLEDIKPDTIVVQDIHLKSNRFVVTSVENNSLPQNDELTLINYPNPFNLSTNFFVKLPTRMIGEAGSITIFNISGQLIRTISIKEGVTAQWDGRDASGSVMSSGVYYYRFNLNRQVMKTGSMILIK